MSAGRKEGDMRDPERIPIVLKRLGEVWEQRPDWRLCQLIVNVTSIDPFYIEDEDLMRYLDELENRF